MGVVNALDRRLISLACVIGPLVTIVVSPWFNYDPINLPKVFILSITSFGMLGLILGTPKILKRFSKKVWLTLLFFPLSLTIPYFFASSPKSQQFWGVFGRNTGILTYLALSILLISVALIRNVNFAEKFLKSMFWTSLFITGYCIIQILGLDPIKWSQNDIFATLGNVNFLSAFLGMSTIIVFALLIMTKQTQFARGSLFLLLMVNIFLIYSTDSIQGIVVLILGATIIIYAKSRNSIKFHKRLLFYAFMYFSIAITAAFGLVKRGPLGPILYQDSTVFRGDYMTAAIKMFTNFPFTGVGIDSYDNWYRRVRGFITSYRTGPTRTTNSSHNIVLDLAAGGGVFVFLGYMAIMLFAFWCGIQTLRKNQNPSIWEFLLFAIWIAYTIQSLVSINQISVGIWGWLLSASLISNFYSKKESMLSEITTTSSKIKQKRSKVTIPKEMIQPLSAILGLLLSLSGAALALPPLSADAKFREAMQKGDLGAIMSLSQTTGVTEFHLAKALEITYKDGKVGEALKISDEIAKRYPFEPFVWQIRAGMTILDENSRRDALQNLEKYDPWFVCFRSNPENLILNWYLELPDEKRWEILSWWEIAKGPLTSKSDLIRLESSERFKERIRSYCTPQG